MNNLSFKLSIFFEFIGFWAKQYSNIKVWDYFEYLHLIILSRFKIINESSSFKPAFTRLFMLKIKVLFIVLSDFLPTRHRHTLVFILVKKE